MPRSTPTDANPPAAPASVSRSRDWRVRRLREARLYLCTDAATLRTAGRAALAEFFDAAYAGGVDIIQLRDSSLEARAEIAAIEVLAEVAQRHGTLFAANNRADVALLVGADVFHVGQGDLTTAQARRVLGEEVLIGRSTATLEQSRQAWLDPGLDYFCTGPVWPTPTKPERAAVGTALPAAAHAMMSQEQQPGGVASKPFFAIGGIDIDRLPQVLATGARRIVVVRAITQAPDPYAAAQALRAGLEAVPLDRV